MTFTNIRDLKYVTANNSVIDLLATCEEYGEIPMTLNLVYTEDLHIYVDTDEKEYPLEEYCKTLNIAPYVERPLEEVEAQRITSIKAKARELIEGVYPLYKQNNILMSGVVVDIVNMNEYITNIRNISNEAELNGTALDDIDWSI